MRPIVNHDDTSATEGGQQLGNLIGGVESRDHHGHVMGLGDRWRGDLGETSVHQDTARSKLSGGEESDTGGPGSPEGPHQRLDIRRDTTHLPG